MKRLKEVEDDLRDGRLPDHDLSRLRQKTWRRIIHEQRRRRKKGFITGLPPWIWAIASIIVLMVGVLFIYWLN